MNAPNKIYIQAQDGKTITRNRVYDTDFEYIRKSALLEWANSVLAKKEITPAMRIAMRGLISKLNSL